MAGIRAFDDFPEIQALGHACIGQLCVDWLRTPVAKECSVDSVSVSENYDPSDTYMALEYVINIEHDRSLPLDEQRYRFPLENLLAFLIDHAVPEEKRGELKKRMPLLRQRDPKAYDEFKTAVPQRLYTQCKNAACGELLETNLTLRPGKTIERVACLPITCQKCGQTFSVSPTDFFTYDDWHKPVDFRELDGLITRDPTVKPFAIRVKAPSGVFQLMQMLSPLSGKINDREFEGRPAETVLFMGPKKGPRGNFADLVFAERPVSFNKLFNKRSGDWEYCQHADTGKPFRPYELADFSSVDHIKLPRSM